MSRKLSILQRAVLSAVVFIGLSAHAAELNPDSKAQSVLEQMTQQEKLSLLQGFLSFRYPKEKLPAGVTRGAGYVPGIERLGVPMLTQSDASLGIANMGGFMRPNDEATALPSALAMASSWDTASVERAGEMIGAETRAKGFNMLLAGGVNLTREPRNGRNFEYLGEDPLLAGVLAGHSIRGIQSNRVLSTIKHFAINAQETGRSFMDVKIDEKAFRESDLLAFQIGIEIGNPAAVMCSYNRVNGAYACENNFLLNDVLRRDWGYKGWVLSDWGAVHSVSLPQGLDQESGTLEQSERFFDEAQLKQSLADGKITQAQIDQSVLRILRTIYVHDIAPDPRKSVAPIDFPAHLKIAQDVAEAGIVLLKNEKDLLPLSNNHKRILIIGSDADKGVPAGGGSSQVWPVGGSPVRGKIKGEPIYHVRLLMPSSPVQALQELMPKTQIDFDNGTDISRATEAASKTDIVIVFAQQEAAEGRDLPDIDLPDSQNELIAAVAKANSKIIVVLETGGPVAMPWLKQVPAVVEAWYAGNRGGHAIARVLTGAVNPSGRLPITFPQSLDQTPNPKLPGIELREKVSDDLYKMPKSGNLVVSYPEGADVGYRWYQRTKAQPQFAFGHGLSYTQFAYSKLSLSSGDNLTATFQLKNIGKREGAEVAQLYVDVDGIKRLVGWARVELKAGESRTVTIKAEPRIIASYDTSERQWHIPAGNYEAIVGAAVDAPKLTAKTRLNERVLKP